MTSAEFQSRFPKPWRFVMFGTTFSLRAANDEPIASLQTQSYHSGISQHEWNRHIAAGLRESPEVVENSKHDRTAAQRAATAKLHPANDSQSPCSRHS